jgi:uncharacterized membrane protein YcaP (DUF421 family)
MAPERERRFPGRLEDHYPFQRGEWRAQRAGLVLLVGLVIAAGFGLFGSSGVILRVVTVYGFLLVVFRVAGKRTVAEMTSFDLIVLLLIGDATQQGLIGDDFSVATAIVAVSCLILMDVALGQVKNRWPTVERVVDGVPLILLSKGKLLRDRMDREGVDLDDILEAAREQHGLQNLEDIDYAVLERHGGLSIIPKQVPARSRSEQEPGEQRRGQHDPRDNERQPER